MKNKFKILYFLLSLILIVQAASFGALSSEAIDYFGNKEFYISVSKFNTEVLTQSVTGGLFYDQLNENQKAIYNAIKNISYTNASVKITFASPYTDSNTGALSTRVQSEFQKAMDAVLLDHPEIFWIKLGSGGSSYSISISYSNSMYQVKELTFNQVISDTYINNISSAVSSLNYAINSFTPSGSTKYDILKSIHDYIAEITTYNANSPYAHDAYGSLVAGQAVCEGYAKAFKLLCDKNGIECMLVVGEAFNGSGIENHMWNYVKMDDGKWYAVDVTWDDQNTIMYDFFLTGSDTVDENFVNQPFSQSHMATGDFSGVGIVFKYPELSLDSYVFSAQILYGDVDGDNYITALDPVYLSRYISNWVGYSELVVPANCDVNADGSIDALDPVILARHIASWNGYETLPFQT